MNTRLKLIRETLNLSQSEFALQLLCSKKSIVNYETGKRETPNKLITALVVKYNVNRDWLLYGKGYIFLETHESQNEELTRSNKLRELRKTLKLTQTELANKLGFNKDSVSNYESDKREITHEFVTALENQFNVNRVWLLYGRGEMFGADSSPNTHKKLVEIRDALNITHDEFAFILGISSYLLTQYENGKKPILENMVKQLQELCDINPQWLLGSDSNIFICEITAQERVYALLTIEQNRVKQNKFARKIRACKTIAELHEVASYSNIELLTEEEQQKLQQIFLKQLKKVST